MKQKKQTATVIAFLITSTVAYGLPDILPSEIVVTPGSIEANGTVRVSVKITNQGNTSAGATTTQFRINSSSNQTVVGDTVLGDYRISSLPAGAWVTFYIRVKGLTSLSSWFLGMNRKRSSLRHGQDLIGERVRVRKQETPPGFGVLGGCAL